VKESRVKKFGVIGLSLLAILVVGVSLAAAQEPADDDVPVAPGVNFIDEDGDGVCDLLGTGAGGNGQAQGYGPRGFGAWGANFVDENGDGQCDLMGTGAAGNGQGQGYGRGYGPQGCGGACGADFVDEDGDGVCDLAGSQGSGPRGQGGNGRGGNGFRGGAGNGFGRGMGQGAWGASTTE
jgi:hypothetical protein